MSRLRSCRVLLVLALGLVPGTGCEEDLATMAPDCGDGVVGPGEECDLADLGGRTCGDLLPGTTGTLLCASDCTFFSGLCGSGVCGDGLLDPGEDCDDGNLTAGDGCSVICTVDLPGVCGDYVVGPGEACDDGNLWSGDGCSATCQVEVPGPCGNGIINVGESCDGLERGGVTCESLGYTGGQVTCDPMCQLDESGCRACTAFELACAEGCVDPYSDPFHCGWCEGICWPVTSCVGGTCLTADAGWHLVEPAPEVAGERVGVHAMVGIDASLFLAWVAADASDRLVKTKRYDLAVGQWEPLNPWPSGSATEIADAVSLTSGDGVPLRVWSKGDGALTENVHGDWWDGASFQEGYPPGWRSACGTVTFLDVARAWWTWEVLIMGQPFCQGAVQHAYLDPAGWQTHPASTGVRGQVIAHAAGRPAIAATDQAYVAVAEASEATTTHTVRRWDEAQTSWVPLGSVLDVNDATGLQEDMALTASAGGTLWVAWSESDGSDPPVHDVWVAQYDPGVEDWVHPGAGPVNPTPGAITPSLLMLGPTLWIAYVDVSGAVGQVRVRRYDPGADSCVEVGSSLNLDPLIPAEAPVLAGSLGMPHVAFREGGALHVKVLY